MTISLSPVSVGIASTLQLPLTLHLPAVIFLSSTLQLFNITQTNNAAILISRSLVGSRNLQEEIEEKCNHYLSKSVNVCY